MKRVVVGSFLAALGAAAVVRRRRAAQLLWDQAAVTPVVRDLR